VWAVEADPERFFGAPDQDRGNDRKVKQLCKQVERAVAAALGDCADDALVDAFVTEVAPAPDARRLAVTVCVGATVDPDRVREALRAATSFLRSRIAGEIHRKRVPEIAFDVRPEEAAARG
jgi:ribosome-binding factor A